MTKTTALVIMILIALCPGQDAPRFSHGTLIVAVGFNGGMAICADKREVEFEGAKKTITDNHVKVKKLSKSLAYFASGTYNIQDFDARTYTEAHYNRDPHIEVGQFVNELKETMEKKVNSLALDILRAPDGFIPNGQDTLFQVVLCEITSTHKLRMYNLICKYSKTASAFVAKIQIGKTGELESESVSGAVNVWGAIQVYTALRAKTDKNYSGLSKQEKDLLDASPGTLKITQKAATMFARKLIKMTSENIKSYSDSDEISQTCDCLILNLKRGVQPSKL